MTRSRLASGAAGLAALGALVVLAAAWQPASQGEPEATAAQPAKAGETRRPIPMPLKQTRVDVSLGVRDKMPTDWDGQVHASEGRILEMRLTRGGPKAKAEGTRFTARSVRQAKKKPVLGPILHLTLDVPPTASITVNTAQGKFAFALADLAPGASKTYLNGRATVEPLDAAVRLTGPETEDDFPALAKGSGDTVWLAYVEYQPGKPIVMERIRAGAFDELVPKGNGDRIRLVRFDGKLWHTPLDVTGGGLDVWRPAVAVDGKGNVVVAWSQQTDGNWDVYYRRYTPTASGAGKWSDAVRLTKEPGTDFHVVAATDSAGTVWLAWQAWRNGQFDIFLAALADNHPYAKPRAISQSKANDWSPAIAADSKGNVYVAHDTYDKGNYDVRLYSAKDGKMLTVAGSPRFEARPHLACDGKGRVWIAYEEGDEQWGKDFSTGQFKRIGFDKNPGYALYINRTIKVKCLADGKLLQPVGDLEAAFGPRAKLNKSVPRLAVDAGGGVWLLVRQHPLLGGAGEVWNSFALRYEGKTWSAPRRLADSANLMDNRPGLVPLDKGVLIAYSGDGRVRTQNRGQTDLFAALLIPNGTTQEPALRPDTTAAGGASKVPVVHPNEAADVARIRDYRVEHGGKKLRLLRGEFHRHTEFTAHRDGDGLLEDSWRYSLDASSMDWMGNGDHDNGFGHEYMWWLVHKMTDVYHHPPRFLAAYTYERSNLYPNGHRNVILPRRNIRPLPRGDLQGTPEKGTPDTKMLYRYLRHFGGICASHTSGTNMGTDWRDNDPLVEPVVEIYQGHRHNYEHFGAPRSPTEDTQIGGYQPAGFVWNALEKGYRLGFQTSSDHVSTHMSYAIVLSEDASRQGLIDAFKRRHCYGATDNIILVVRSGEHLMGDAFETAKRPTMDITVHGTGPVAKVHVIRDNKYVYTAEPKKQEVKLRYSDMDAKAGKPSYYYVRVEQADGNLAWGSPMWITYKP